MFLSFNKLQVLLSLLLDNNSNNNQLDLEHLECNHNSSQVPLDNNSNLLDSNKRQALDSLSLLANNQDLEVDLVEEVLLLKAARNLELQFKGLEVMLDSPARVRICKMLKLNTQTIDSRKQGNE